MVNHLVNGTAAGPWWDGIDATIESYLKIDPNSDRELPSTVEDIVSGGRPPTIYEAGALAMAITHIGGDLKWALATQGLGTDGDWTEMGKIVDASMTAVLGQPRMWAGGFVQWATQPNSEATDVLAMRNNLRERVKKAAPFVSAFSGAKGVTRFTR